MRAGSADRRSGRGTPDAVSGRSLARFGGLAAIVSGVLFAFGLPLVATQATDDPVGLRYDDFNRWLTLPLALLVAALVAVRGAQSERLGPRGRLGATLAIVGAGAMLLGNLVEFWLVFFTDDYVAAIADERRELDEWVGSTVGWLLFLAGAFLLLVGGILLGVETWRAHALPVWVGAVVASTAPLLLAAFVAWSISVEATIVLALVLGIAWVAVGLRLRTGPRGAPREAVVR